MDHRSDQSGFRLSFSQGLADMLRSSCSSRSDDRNACPIGDRPGQPDVVAVFGSVRIHAREKDLARAKSFDCLGPLQGINPGGSPAAVDVDLPSGGMAFRALRVHGNHDALRAELVRRFGYQAGALDRSRVDSHLVSAGLQYSAEILDAPDSPADGERNEHLLGGAGGKLYDDVAPLVAGGDIQEDDLVRALLVVERCEFDRVTGIAEIDELRALDDPSFFDVEARDYTFGEHSSLLEQSDGVIIAHGRSTCQWEYGSVGVWGYGRMGERGMGHSICSLAPLVGMNEPAGPTCRRRLARVSSSQARRREET